MKKEYNNIKDFFNDIIRSKSELTNKEYEEALKMNIINKDERIETFGEAHGFLEEIEYDKKLRKKYDLKFIVETYSVESDPGHGTWENEVVITWKGIYYMFNVPFHEHTSTEDYEYERNKVYQCEPTQKTITIYTKKI